MLLQIPIPDTHAIAQRLQFLRSNSTIPLRSGFLDQSELFGAQNVETNLFRVGDIFGILLHEGTFA